MRIFLVILAICCVSSADSGRLSCNQKVYDELYSAIIRQVMKTKMTKADFDVRNNSIETLRELCNGQKSSWEGK